jgi:polar amino acid transport system substrate-binding protein
MRSFRAFLAVVVSLVWFPAHSRGADAPLDELAPTGRLRVALQTTNPVLVTRDSGSIDIRGIAPDVARVLSDRLRIAFQPIRYATVPQLLEGLRVDAWDVTFLTIDQERAALVDYTSPFIEVDNALAVVPSSRVTSLSDIDVPNVRIAVIDGSSNSLLLGRTLKSAQLVRTPAADAAVDLLRNARVDAFADNRQLVQRVTERLPGARMLTDRYSAGLYGMAVPRGNGRALKYLSEFVDREKRSGLFAYAIARAELRGVTVALGR